MKILKRLTRGLEDANWAVVQDGLVDRCGVGVKEARTLCIGRRAAVEFVPRSLRGGIFHDREPFDVAMDPARRHHGAGWHSPDPGDTQVAVPYEAILARHGLS